LDKIPDHLNPLIDHNPHTAPGQTRFCFDYLNKGSCPKDRCLFRHLMRGHPDTAADARDTNGRPIPLAIQPPMYGTYGAAAQPAYGAAATAAVSYGYGTAAPQQPTAWDTPQYGATAAPQQQSQAGSDTSSLTWQGYTAAEWAEYAASMAQYGTAPTAQPPTYVTMPQQQPPPASSGYVPSYTPLAMVPAEAAAASWQYTPPASTASWAAMPAMPAPANRNAPMGMCFNFINKGVCQRGSDCRFQHLGPDHPDVLENKAKFDAECAQRMAQKAIDMDDQALWIKTIGGPPV
jgi:hypothetical protein